jgi:hypothetical protein
LEHLMTTVIHRQADAQAEYNASLLIPGKVRRSALSCITGGITPETLRTGLVDACPDLAPVWQAWADELDLLAAHGFSGSTPREAAKIALTAGDATAGDLRQPGIYPGAPAMRRRAALIAGEMDALLAEGFDAAVFEKEISEACGGAR